jgi:hypothetical protein
MSYSGVTNTIKLYFNCLLCKQFYNIYGRYVLYVANRWQWSSFHFYWLSEDGAILSLLSHIDIPDMLFFKDLKYFDPGAIYQKHKALSITNEFRKPMFVLFFSMYMINDMKCKWTNESVDFTCRGAVLDSSNNL